jgi:hypothetical protein
LVVPYTDYMVAVAEIDIRQGEVHDRQVDTVLEGHFAAAREIPQGMAPELHRAGDRMEGRPAEVSSPRNWRERFLPFR